MKIPKKMECYKSFGTFQKHGMLWCLNHTLLLAVP